MSIDKAVILAAGLGNRIAKVSEIPTPFLPLDGTPEGLSFVDWHVDRLTEFGVREIYVVGNQKTCGRPLRAAARDRVKWVLNPTEDINRSGSGHSTWFAWKSEHNILDGRSRVLLMDADIFYEPALFPVLDGVKSGGHSRTLVCEEFRESNEEVMVFGHGHHPVTHGKGLLGTSLVHGLECLGEATGMLLWEPRDHARLFEATDWCIRYSTAKEKSEHEDITQRMMMMNAMEAALFSGLLFMECDTPEEYEHLTRDFHPRMRERVEF